MSRAEWLKLLMQHGSRKGHIRQALRFLAFESYYWLCKLRGYPVPHPLLDPKLAGLEGAMPGDRYMLVTPPLPLSIRLLDRVFGTAGHAKLVPYTPGAATAAQDTGRRVTIVEVTSGEFKMLGG